jgi:hypothetical protein
LGLSASLIPAPLEVNPNGPPFEVNPNGGFLVNDRYGSDGTRTRGLRRDRPAL